MYAENLKKKLGLLLTLVLLFTAALAVMAPCVASAAGEVTLTTASTIVPADSLFYLEVSAPGASKIYLEHRNPQSSRWNEEEYKSADGETATFEEQWGQSRVFRAKAIINGTEYYSDIVTIEVTMLGMLETPAYVYPTTVVDGEDYVITWEDVPEAGYYVFDLFAYDPTTGSRSRIWYNDAAAGEETFTISTSALETEKGEIIDLEPGTYLIDAYPDARGWDRQHTQWQFTITEATTSPVTLTASATRVLSDSPVYFEASAPGASAIRLERLSTSSGRWSKIEEKSGETVTFTRQWNQPQTVRASACINGSWDYYSDSITIEITYLGTLQVPNYVYPDSVKLGDDYVITWEDVPEAGFYMFDLINAEGFVWFSDAPAGVETFTIPTKNLVHDGQTFDLEPGVYTVSAYPRAAGWNWVHTEWDFTVTAEQPDSSTLAAPVVTLDKSSYLAGEDITVSWTPVENAQSYKVSLDDSYGNNINWTLSDTNTYTISRPLPADEYTVTVEASAADYASSTSEAIVITITSELLAGPTVTTDKTQILPNEEVFFSSTYANATKMTFKIANGSSYSISPVTAFEGTATMSNTFGQLGTYEVSVSAYVNGRWTDYGAPLTITVAEETEEPEEPTVTISLSETSVFRGTTITFTGSAPGASSIRLEAQKGENWDPLYVSEGDSFTFERQWSQPWKVRVAAVIDGTTYYSEVIETEIIYLGMLETPEYVYPDTVVDGEDYVITWEDVPEAGYYVFDLFPEPDTTHRPIWFSDAAAGVESFTIPTSAFETEEGEIIDLTPGTYKIHAYPDALNWNREATEWFFTVTEAAAEPTVTLTASATSVLAGSTCSFEVSAPGASMVRLERLSTDGTVWRNLVEQSGAAATFTITHDWLNPQTFRASACFDGSWDYHSATVSLEVTYLGMFETPKYVYSDSVVLGEPYVITWTDVSNATSYTFDMLDSKGAYVWGNTIPAGVQTFSIPTTNLRDVVGNFYDLEPGLYTVIAWPHTTGWNHEPAEWDFTVIEAPAAELTLTPAAQLMIPGEKRLIEVSCTGEEVPTYTWTSSDEDIVTVENGIVTSTGIGEATITVTATFANGATVTAESAVGVFNFGTYDLPAALVRIEDEAFDTNGAQCIIVPEGVTYIGSNAFANNDELMFVIIKGKDTQMDLNAIANCTGVRIVCHKDSAVHQNMVSNGVDCWLIGE